MPRSGRFGPLLLLVAGDPVPAVQARRGGFSTLIREAAGDLWPAAWSEVDLRTDAPLPDPADVSAVVVTGSASSVTERAPWILRGEEYLRSLVRAEVPTFGICFGHQMLGQALGGSVSRNPRGREIGTVPFEIVGDDPLLEGLPDPLRANATHVDTVSVLPEGARILARTALEPHAAVRFGRAAWGVQFHPEMDADVVRGYVEARRDVLSGEGLDVDALVASADDALAGQLTLRRFLSLIRSR
ncbi:MAG TPA: glutamine amidotransferase [Polyangiaceae bacterium]|nr:glutamine amidotransferase [Polyangiaceae bacterium]